MEKILLQKLLVIQLVRKFPVS